MSKLIYIFFAIILIVIIVLLYKYLNKKKEKVIEKFRTCNINDPKLAEIINKLKLLHNKVNTMNFCIDDIETYTEDKSKTYMCLKDKNGNYYPDNMLMYVAIHELAHAISEKIDTEHVTSEFHENFKFLLKKAESLGIYDPNIPPIDEYCNIKKY